MSASNSRHSMFFGLPLFRFPSGFQVRACFVMQFDDFHNVCPIHLQRLFLISSSAGSCFVLSHSRLLLMVSGQRTLSVLRRQLFMNTCISLMMIVVVLQVSALYSRTVLTFVLKILTMILVDSYFEFHIFFNCRNVVLALPILVFASASDPWYCPVWWVNVSTSSIVSPSSVTGLVSSVLQLRILVFPLCMLRPTDTKASVTLVVLICIYWCVWDRRAM
ncbi:hypothetical protein MS3_00004121 [Schistosoma haematobium]|uniref:Transmembrane protein n=1 Tax=Schistosoma haematobium TaxID=6185 RepID=A0A922LRR5_SCHHA|nr:hypothetical protein MS3_00004121 [Schistosoma haematobium]KAH9592064.1 hypothetical protein MS3_00004121 [Schistosoma haematobium]